MNKNSLLVAIVFALLLTPWSEAQLLRRGKSRRNSNQASQRQQQQYQQQRYQQQLQQQQRYQQQLQQQQLQQQQSADPQQSQSLTRRQQRIQKRQASERQSVEYQYLVDRRTGRMYYMPKKDYERWVAAVEKSQKKNKTGATKPDQQGVAVQSVPPSNRPPQMLTSPPMTSTQTVARPTVQATNTKPRVVAAPAVVAAPPVATPVPASMLELNPPSIADEPSAGGSDLIPLTTDAAPGTAVVDLSSGASKSGASIAGATKPAATKSGGKMVSVLENKPSNPKKR